MPQGVPMTRAALIAKLQSGETFDLLVIGGGATGCGIALDAASRGLKVALVEKGDFAGGTSGRSTKLIHGGVRYLEAAVLNRDRVQFNLVRDALHERSVLLKISPHLCRRITLVTPLYRFTQVPYVWAGLKAYDLLAGEAGLGRSGYLTPAETLRRYPMINREGLKGAVTYYDGQFNDARMNIALALTAQKEGALLANHLEVIALFREKGRVAGALVRDHVSDAAWQIRARCVVNACGPTADLVRQLDDPIATPLLRVSRGVHIALPGRFAPPDAGILVPRTEDGRVLFVLPWQGGCIVGTTEDPAAPGEVPMAGEKDVTYLLRHLGRYLNLKADESDITARWAGLRPLVHDPFTADTAELARDHVISCSPYGLVTVVGGKWTTYRKMALDAVDYVVKSAGLATVGGCRTEEIMLHGGAGFHPGLLAELTGAFALPEEVAVHLYGSYGDCCLKVAEICRGELAERLAPGHPYLKGEVLYAVRHEMALTVLDFLERRVRLALLDQRAALSAVPAVLDLMAAELSWSEERRAQERTAVLARLS